MLWQVDNMADKLNRALAELHEVKGQLATMQENPAKRFVSRVADAVEERLHAMQERLAEMKAHIVEGAKEAVEGFKRTGVKALDGAVSALGIRKALESMQKGIGFSFPLSADGSKSSSSSTASNVSGSSCPASETASSFVCPAACSRRSTFPIAARAMLLTDGWH